MSRHERREHEKWRRRRSRDRRHELDYLREQRADAGAGIIGGYFGDDERLDGVRDRDEEVIARLDR